jgi:hypothetical protein
MRPARLIGMRRRSAAMTSAERQTRGMKNGWDGGARRNRENRPEAVADAQAMEMMRAGVI